MQQMTTAEPVPDFQKRQASGTSGIRIGLSERLSLQTIEGRQTVFAEKSQLVFEPDAASCAILALLDTPLPLTALFDQLLPAFAGNRKAVAAMLVDWSKAGLIDAFLPHDCDSELPSATVCLPALDATVDLQVHGEDTGWFDCYRHLPEPSNSGRRIQTWQCPELGIIKVTGEQGRIVPRHMLAAGFRYGLVESILNRTECIVLHCASLIKNDRAMLLLGASGAGKSTLAMFASQNGLELGGDDIALFDPASRRILPLALPLTLKQGSWPMIARSSWSRESQEAVLREDEVEVVYLPLSRTVSRAPLAVRALILLDRDRQAEPEPELSAWSKIDCLRHLCNESRSHSGTASVEDMQALLGMLDQSEPLTLRYANATEAGGMLGSQFGG